MNRRATLTLAAFLILVAQPALAQSGKMNFFLTSSGPGHGADLGGIEGADQYCAQLASAVSAGDLTWRAYLSVPASGDQPAVNARDRIGSGPWYNTRGALIAQNLGDLHGGENAKWTKEAVLSETGEPVNGRGDSPNMHDILTGSQLDGTAFPSGDDTTCSNWTSSTDGQGSARVGHHDKQGGGDNPNSWNSAHASRGCSQTNLKASGGNGLFYCFGIG